MIFTALLLMASGAAAQSYQVTIKRQTHDPISGERIFTPSALKARITIDRSDGTVEWRSAAWGRMDDLRDEPATFAPWPEFAGFRYRSGNADFLDERFYEAIPADKQEWARMLATDIPWVDQMAAQVIDSLEYKQAFYPSLMERLDIEMENSFTFSSSYVKYEWSAVTEHNGTPCAVVTFESPFNPMSNGPVKGRSAYYGEMRVSLGRKRIEYLRMVEDVIFSIPPANEKVFDLQRIVTFEQILP